MPRLLCPFRLNRQIVIWRINPVPFQPFDNHSPFIGQLPVSPVVLVQAEIVSSRSTLGT